MYIIVVGAGKVGYYLAKELLEAPEGHEVLIIELDAAKVERVTQELGDIALRGDGCEAATMEKAGYGRAAPSPQQRHSNPGRGPGSRGHSPRERGCASRRVDQFLVTSRSRPLVMSGPAGQAGTPQQRAGLRLAFLGPAGTFSEEAALKYDAQSEPVPMPSITAVASAVDSGMADLGIVLIENSLELSVTEPLH